MLPAKQISFRPSVPDKDVIANYIASYSTLLGYGEEGRVATYYIVSTDGGTIFIATSMSKLYHQITNHSERNQWKIRFEYVKRDDVTFPNFDNDAFRSMSSSNFIGLKIGRDYRQIPKPGSLRLLLQIIKIKQAFFLPEEALAKFERAPVMHSNHKTNLDLILKDVILLKEIRSAVGSNDSIIRNHIINDRLVVRENRRGAEVTINFAQLNPDVGTFILENSQQIADQPSIITLPEVVQVVEAVPSVPPPSYEASVISQENVRRANTCRFCRLQFDHFSWKVLHFGLVQHNDCLSRLTSLAKEKGALVDSSSYKDIMNSSPLLRAILVVELGSFAAEFSGNITSYLLTVKSPDHQYLPPCEFCGEMFDDAFVYSSHNCFGDPWTIRVRSPSSNQAKQGSDYPSVERSFIESYLNCPICKKKFGFISALAVHLKTFDVCKQGFEGSLKNILPIVFTESIEVPCDACDFVAGSRLMYLLHRDHHLPAHATAWGGFCCKGCNRGFRTPCAFYHHICADPNFKSRWCIFCYLNVKETTSLPEISFVQSTNRVLRQPEQQENEVAEVEEDVVEVAVPAEVVVEAVEPVDDIAFEAVCTTCYKILKSHRIYEHLVTYPQHESFIEPMKTFNSFDLALSRSKLH